MNCYSRLPQALLRLSVLCAALGAAYSTSAQTLPPFTLSPPGSTPPLAGTAVRADNIIISDFSTVSPAPASATAASCRSRASSWAEPR